METAALSLFHFVYFASFSIVNFLPRYFGEMGLSDGQIGTLLSVSAVVSVVAQPFFGVLTDRIRYKRSIVIALLFLLTGAHLVLDRLVSFGPLLLWMSVYMLLQAPISSVNATISLEYLAEKRKPYGPIRMLGTVGYQLGALLPGALLAANLTGLFRLMAACMLVSLCIAWLLPRVPGHQHARRKMSVGVLLRDRHLRALLLMALIGTTTSQYYIVFFVRHMGNLGVSNSAIGWVFLVSVIMELPFLLYADRLFQRANIWSWFLVAYVINGVRWIGTALTTSIPLLFLLQLPEVSILACFEFFPALYINRRVPDELKGSAQTLLMVVTFGFSKIIGSMIGGFVTEWVGIPAVFAFNGCMLLLAAATGFRPTRRLIEDERMGA